MEKFYNFTVDQVSIGLDETGIIIRINNGTDSVTINTTEFFLSYLSETLKAIHTNMKNIETASKMGSQIPKEKMTDSMEFGNAIIIGDYSQKIVWIGDKKLNIYGYIYGKNITAFIKLLDSFINAYPVIFTIMSLSKYDANKIQIGAAPDLQNMQNNNETQPQQSQQLSDSIEIKTNKVDESTVNHQELNQNNDQQQDQQTQSESIIPETDSLIDKKLLLENLTKIEDLVNVLITSETINDKNIDEFKKFMEKYWNTKITISNGTLLNIINDIRSVIVNYLTKNEIDYMVKTAFSDDAVSFLREKYDSAVDNSDKIKIVTTAMFIKEVLTVIKISSLNF